MGAALRQGLLGRFAAGGDSGELALEPLAVGAGLGRGRLRPGLIAAVDAQVVARQLPARLERLPLQPRVQLRRLGLALERAQPRARLALDVERAVEVLLGALELQLGAAPALAVLAEARGLLDQHAAGPAAWR